MVHVNFVIDVTLAQLLAEVRSGRAAGRAGAQTSLNSEAPAVAILPAWVR